MKASKPLYDKPSIGCYLDQANYTNDELSAEIISIAQGYGMELDADLVTLLAMTDEEIEACDDYSEQMDSASEEAIDWLNEQETRSFLYWANEGEANAFGLWANVEGAKEDCGFHSTNKQEYPEDDYEGEWLHGNDHGNATLYVRTAGKHVEIWSIV